MRTRSYRAQFAMSGCVALAACSSQPRIAHTAKVRAAESSAIRARAAESSAPDCVARPQLDCNADTQAMCATLDNAGMDALANARQDWDHAQEELQRAAAELKKFVDEGADPAVVQLAFERLERKRHYSDDCLQRYITQLGKS